MAVHGSSEKGIGESGDTDADFAAVLRTAIARRGLTLARARARVQELGDTVSVATLSQWQSGRSLPGRRIGRGVLGSLEVVLELPPGALHSALERTRERHRRELSHPTSPMDLYPRGETVQAAFDALSISFQDGFTQISALERLRLTANGVRAQQWSVLTLRAEVDGLRRFSVCQFDPTGATPPPTYLAGTGCALRGEFVDPTEGVTVAEFELPHAVEHGELTTVEIEAHYPAGVAPVRAFDRVHRTPIRDAALEVVFDAARLPHRVEQFYSPAGPEIASSQNVFRSADTYGQRPLLGCTAQAYFSQLGPGVSGLRWTWPDDPDIPVVPDVSDVSG